MLPLIGRGPETDKCVPMNGSLPCSTLRGLMTSGATHSVLIGFGILLAASCGGKAVQQVHGADAGGTGGTAHAGSGAAAGSSHAVGETGGSGGNASAGGAGGTSGTGGGQAISNHHHSPQILEKRILRTDP